MVSFSMNRANLHSFKFYFRFIFEENGRILDSEEWLEKNKKGLLAAHTVAYIQVSVLTRLFATPSSKYGGLLGNVVPTVMSHY